MLRTENSHILQEVAVKSLHHHTYYYCKDRQAKYLDCNERVAHALSLASIADIKQLTDDDFGWDANRIKKLHEIDMAVIQQGQPISQVEDPFLLPDGKTIQLLTHKLPLRDHNLDIMGVIGISIDISEKNIDTMIKDPMQVLKETLSQKTCVALSQRETECLYYLMKGKTARDIGALLFLSSRTVEFHLGIVKEKFNCRKKSELLDLIWQLFDGAPSIIA